MCRSIAHRLRAVGPRALPLTRREAAPGAKGEFVGLWPTNSPSSGNERQRATEGDACRVWCHIGHKPDKRARATTRGAGEGPTTAGSLPLGDAVSVAQNRARKRLDRPDATLRADFA